jgi:hypothetical protein
MADTGAAAVSDRLELSAGDLSATLEGGALRWIRWRGVEVLRGLELTVRDSSWGTLEPRVVSRSISQPDAEGRVEVVLELSYVRDAIDFKVRATISMSVAGELALAMNGVARSSFQRNRIGIICLHPMAAAGRSATLRHPDGEERTSFPAVIDPDPVSTDLVGVRWRPAAGIAASLSLSGELWEMEDQRNWTDASFKTYPTPLRIPYPVGVAKGQVIEQRAVLSITGAPRSARSRREPSDDLVIGRGSRPFPRLESELPPDLPVETAPIDLLRELGLAGIRGVVDPEDEGRPWAASELADVAQQVGSRPVFDLIAPSRSLDRRTASALADADLVYAFDRVRGAVDSSDAVVRSVGTQLRKLNGRIRIGGGTRGNFAEFNRARIDATLPDAVTYAANPQVHAFDEESMVETLPVLPVTVRDARRRTPRPISIVLSLRPRFNAAMALGKDRPVHADPARADPRQATLFAAAWMLGALANLSVRGVEAVTVAETHGPAGLIQPDSAGGYAFTPLAGLIASTCASAGGRSVAVQAPDDIAAVAIRDAVGTSLWLANLRPSWRTVRVAGQTVREVATLTTLPVASRADAWPLRRLRDQARGSVDLEFEPWEVLRLGLA